MAFTYKHYNSKAATSWQWPLLIGIMPDSEDLLPVLKQGYWTFEFTSIRVLNESTGQLNILFFPKGVLNARTNLEAMSVKTDVVLILQDGMDTLRPEHEPGFMHDIAFIRERVQPSAVIVVSPALELGRWFHEVIIRFSHNNNVIQAVRTDISGGYFEYDPKVEEETRVSDVLNGIINALRLSRDRPGPHIPVSNPLVPPGDYTAGALYEALSGLPKNLPYDHESGTATAIASMRRQLQGTGAERYFHEHVKQPAKSEGYGDAAPEKGATGTQAGDREFNYGTPYPPVGEIKGFPAGDKYESMPEFSPATPPPAASPQERPPLPETPPAPPGSPRFLQAKIHTTANFLSGEVTDYLYPDTLYKLEVRIGLPEGTWQNSPIVFDTATVFRDSTAQEERIDLLFSYDGGKTIEQAYTMLPRSGNSTPVDFLFRTGTQPAFDGVIEAYHKNKLIQKISLSIPVRKTGEDAARDGISIKLLFCSNKTLDNLGSNMEYGASVTYREGDQAGASLNGMAGNKPLSLYHSQALSKLMVEIRDLIQKAVIKIDEHPEDLHAPKNVALLRKLAFKGNDLFVHHLKKNNKLKGPLQVISNRPEFVPLDFVYELPPPALTATLCDNAREALREGACRNCYDKTLSPAPHICPFGFWGFSQIIERSCIEKADAEPGDYLIQAEPIAGRDELDLFHHTLYAATVKIDAHTPQLIQKVKQALSQYSFKAEQAEDWTNWSRITQAHNPDSLVLLVHVEKEKETEIDQVEIGDQQFLLQNYFNSSYLMPTPSQRAPFVILIGCETADIENQGFDLSDRLLREGAAIVISNFTKIRGRHAGPIVIKLVEFFQQEKKKGEVMTLGKVMLKLRQFLLSEGIMVGLALVAHGDAQWKIKT